MSLANKLSVKDVDLKGQRVVVRVDFNVISAVTGTVDDDTRVQAACPTIEYILDQKPRAVILLSHCGRPNGVKDPKFSLFPVVSVLEKHLNGRKVIWLTDCVGPAVEKAIAECTDGTVFLCENLRFYKEEEGKGCEPANLAKFKSQLSSLGDIVVLDAFGTAHRAHSSITGIDKRKVAGLLLKKELDYFSMVLENPTRPFLAIIGGAKVRDKIQVIKSLVSKVDEVIIGGGMAYTFLKVHFGSKIGNSLYDEVGAQSVPEIMRMASEGNVKIHLPVDFNCGEEYKNDTERQIVTVEDGVPDGWEGYDIGPKSIEMVKEVIARAKLICWNGPMGVFEFPNFAIGSEAVLDAVCKATKTGCITVVGGGDSAAMVNKYKRQAEMSHVSTGGGASLELLEGKVLPGVDALDSK